MKTTDYLSVRQFAENRGVAVQSIHKRILKGQIKAQKVGGEFYLIHRSELKKMKKKKKRWTITDIDGKFIRYARTWGDRNKND